MNNKSNNGRNSSSKNLTLLHFICLHAYNKINIQIKITV